MKIIGPLFYPANMTLLLTGPFEVSEMSALVEKIKLRNDLSWIEPIQRTVCGSSTDCDKSFGF
jgi:hypothetical protein